MKTYSHIYHYAMLVTSRTWEDSTQQKPNEKLFWIYQNSVELAYRHSMFTRSWKESFDIYESGLSQL